MARADISDVVDKLVVITAHAISGANWTSDPDDLRRLNDHLPEPLQIQRI